MLSSARTTQRLVYAALFATAVAACSASDQPGDPAVSGGGAPPAGDQATAPQAGLSLAEQKRDLMLSMAMDNGRSLREQGDDAGARRAFEEAVAIDPGHLEAQAQLAEVLEQLGERPGDIETTRLNAEKHANAKIEQLKLEAEEQHRVGQDARVRREFDASIRWFERVQQSIDWSSLNVNWGDLPKRNADALTAAREERDQANKADNEAKLKTAVAKIQGDEAAEASRHNARVVSLLESANCKYEAGNYGEAMELCDQVLTIEPSSTTAKELKVEANAGRRAKRTEEFAKQRSESYRRFKADIEELRVPYSDGLTPPDADYWARVSARQATGAGGVDAAAAEDMRIKEQLKAIRIPVVDFVDADLDRVCTMLSNWSGLTIRATEPVRTEVETNSTLINLTNLTNLSLDSVLTIVTKRLGEKFAWTVTNGIVQITTLEEAFGSTVIRTHAIQDLTFGRTDFKGPEINKIALPGEYGDDPETSVFAADLEKIVQITPEDIVMLIKTNVARETWELGDKKFNIEPAANNQIMVIHTREVQDEIEAFLNDLRRFTTTVVSIESRFVEVTDAFIQEFGADLRGLGGVFGSSVSLDDTTNGGDDLAGTGLDNFGTGSTATGSPSAGVFFNDFSDGDLRGRTENYFDTPLGSILTTNGGGSFQFGLLDDTAFNLVVNAVDKSVNAVEVMAPELTVFNTERAYVTVLNEVSFLQDFDVDVANTAFIANPEIGILQEGVVLDVRPTVSYDRKYVTLDVRTTVATIQRPIDTFETTLGGFSDAVTFQLPRLEVQNANTTVIVPDGGAIILGGLKTLNYVNRRAEVPWLSRIPLLGFFFREKGVADEAQSLVILVKANIRDLSKFRESVRVR